MQHDDSRWHCCVINRKAVKRVNPKNSHLMEKRFSSILLHLYSFYSDPHKKIVVTERTVETFYDVHRSDHHAVCPRPKQWCTSVIFSIKLKTAFDQKPCWTKKMAETEGKWQPTQNSCRDRDSLGKIKNSRHLKKKTKKQKTRIPTWSDADPNLLSCI